ncbi:Ig-like domain-containing protein [Humibacter ginsenosidimutans]|uniref:Tandem-95 repeat protein n=1 Tax=Humibacter ginsenosidimutans TaxID=2599293 RepID=A0A5B8M920_9MICO|nr:Ig-like domain-containing protein [Humibacter ginsenosidimutans]QDZ16564.1 tandem-95 repeat protein [Humibacter ginsenosidimutans]
MAWTVIVGVVVVALTATIAIVSGGFVQQRMVLGDAAVWVTNSSKQLLGRANTAIDSLNSAVVASATSVDVVQSGSSVLLVDHSDNTVSSVDTATVTAGKPVALPPRDAQIGIAGSRAVIVSGTTGQIWLLPLKQLETFTSGSTPTIDLGSRVITSLSPGGTLYAYSSQAATMYRIDAEHGDQVAQTWHVEAPGKASSRTTPLQLTSTGAGWMLYDATSRTLRSESGTHVLPAAAGDGGVVAQPTDAETAPVVAADSGVFVLSGTAFRHTESGSYGTPAAPVWNDGCLYAAWNTGQTWRSCTGGAAGRPGTLASLRPGSALTFRVNDGTVVLNDTAHGTTWSVQHGNALIDNWSDFAKPDDTTTQSEENTEDTPPKYEKAEVPPVAVDDEFGARPGTTSPLPVLLNDYDANGDVLVIDSFTPIPQEEGRIARTADDQQLQITLPADASGRIRFEYTISDGRGGEAQAQVTVTVRTPDENSPPVQVRATKATVAAGGRVSTQVLGDWYDPDGDPIYLVSATTASPDSASSTPEGTVVFTGSGSGTGMRNVALTVSDGRAEAHGTLAVTVRRPTEVPIIVDPFVATVTAGDQITISPLAHVRGGVGTVRLASVPDKPDVTLQPNLDDGTFTFSSDTPGSYYVDYTVTDGQSTATGEVRVVVSAPQDAGDAPVTVPHNAFIEQQSSGQVDVTATDYDPAGGVLLVTGVAAPKQSDGVSVQVLEQHILRVTLTRPLSGPVTFGYTVSNGTASTNGTVRVVEIPRPAVRQPPVADPDSATVRVGDAIDIPVLDNDSQADGDDLTLDPVLPTPLPKGAGLLFASGNVLRYLAPDKPGNYTAVYRVDDADGQWATAQVSIAVREIDVASNRAPVPQTVTARVLAGNTVRIPIPLSGIDPDGDSVKLVGQSTNPQKGAVTSVGPNWIDYQAGDYSAGTDTFDYTVVDALGAHADGVVRIGIAPQDDTARNPVAVEDQVAVRPGRTVSVQVLANDSDPDGGALHIVSVQRTSTQIAKATFTSKIVKVVAPKKEGRYGFIYTIQNDAGGTSSNFLTVVVRADAPLSRPVVQDTVVSLSDILGKQQITVDPLANVFFADGPVSSLKLSLVDGFGDTAHVTSDGRVRVRVLAKSQIIPFKVTHPDDASISSFGFIWVPGLDDALPQLKPGAPKLTVQSEKTLVIDLDKYVVAAGGKSVRLTDSSHVHATHADGSSLVRNSHTLVYTSASRYFGPASISFEVTDGSSANDPRGHIATLVLPITVTARDNQPPTFTGAQVDFEPGQQKTLDLLKLTRYPYARDQGELQYSVLDPQPQGASVSLQGSSLTVKVSDQTGKGTHLSVIVGVRDAVNTGKSGRIDITVVPSTRPLAVPQPDQVVARRGVTTTVNVLANDAATNPFPSTPLRVIAVRGLANGALPQGVSVTPSADRSHLTVSVAANAVPADTTLQYEVADATNDPARYTWGTVTISVEDRPEPVSNVSIAGVADHQLTVAWDAGSDNNSAIKNYVVSLVASGQVVGTTTCDATTCTVPTPGNGPQNAVTVQVVAVNGIGRSDPVSYPDAVWSNVVPGAPTDVTATRGDQSIRVSWDPPKSGGGSVVTAYRVSVGTATVTVDGGTTSAKITGLTNGQQVQATVTSMNDFYGVSPAWNSAVSNAVTPAGAPIWISTPSVTPRNDANGTVDIGWGSAANANGSAITSYSVSCGSQTVTTTGTSTSCTLPTGQSTTVTVTASNDVGSSTSQPVSATPPAAPQTPTRVTVYVADPGDSQNGRFVPTFQGVSPTPSTSGGGSVSYSVKINGGDPQQLGIGDHLPVQSNQYGVQLSVSVQVTVTYPNGATLSSGWSDPVSAGMAVDATLGGLQYTPAANGNGGTFSWTSAPGTASTTPAGPYNSVSITCNGTQATGNTCTTNSTNPTLAVRVGANGRTYEMDYPGQ